jgi:hypothetical protein
MTWRTASLRVIDNALPTSFPAAAVGTELRDSHKYRNGRVQRGASSSTRRVISLKVRMAKDAIGTCETCRQTFSYRLIHNGFNDSAFAYCDRCGYTPVLSGYYQGIPGTAKLALHEPVNAEAECLLTPCSCGGSFRATAISRKSDERSNVQCGTASKGTTYRAASNSCLTAWRRSGISAIRSGAATADAG